MATGTGKTYTGLGAVVRLFEEKKRLAIIIVCPYQHLVEQWVEDIEAREFLFYCHFYIDITLIVSSATIRQSPVPNPSGTHLEKSSLCSTSTCGSLQ